MLSKSQIPLVRLTKQTDRLQQAELASHSSANYDAELANEDDDQLELRQVEGALSSLQGPIRTDKPADERLFHNVGGKTYQ